MPASRQAEKGIGEVGRGVAAGVISREDVTELGAVLTGETDGRRSAGDMTLFDSSGLAIQDLAIAKVAYAKRGELELPQLGLSSGIASAECHAMVETATERPTAFGTA